MINDSIEPARQQYDAVIIGAGLGGLTAGARLAREGKNVLVLEQHSVPGGCATTFGRNNFRIEVGLHEMDGFRAGNFKQKIFTELGIFDHLSFPEAPHFYRVILPGYDVTIPHDTSAARDLLGKLFPHESEGLETYFHRMENFRKYRPSSDTEHHESVGIYLDRIFNDEHLKLILLGNLMAFSDDPYLLAMDYYAQAQGTFYQSGGVFIKGGSQMLSDYLAGYIRNRGGKVLTRHLAEEITVENGLCTGVKYRSLASGITHYAKGRNVIANAAMPQVAGVMLPEEFGSRIVSATRERTAGASLFTLYMAFGKPLREIGNSCYCTCVYGDGIRSIRDIGPNSRGSFDQKTFVLTDYSHIDSGLAPDGGSVAAMVAEDYVSEWQYPVKKDYRERKEMVTRSFLDRMEKLVPGLNEHLVWYDSATACTVERYTMNTQGAVYGFAQLPGPRSRDRISPIPILYFAYAWYKFGGGFSAAIYSGYFTAMELLRQERIQSKTT